jgi:hypothetical protein
MVLSLLVLLAGCQTKDVTITSSPTAARMYIDGADLGVSPLTTKLEFDDDHPLHNVTARMPGYRDNSIQITYEPKEKTSYHIELEVCAKTVKITTDPAGAKIYINGLESGISPLTTTLDFSNVTQYEIKARLEEYDDATAFIRLDPVGMTEYPLTLRPAEVVVREVVEVKPQPAPGGAVLAPTLKRALAYREVIERCPNVRSVTRVTDNEDQRLRLGPPRLSPVDDLLVYNVFVEEEGQRMYSNTWQQTVGAFARTRLTHGKSLDVFPAFSPDGENIVFSSDRTSTNSTLWRVSIGGAGGITKITSSSAIDYAPSVWPDGSAIAYVSKPRDAEDDQIWTIRWSGTLPTQLREGEVPQVSPDGKRILFVRRDKDSGRKQLWMMDADGSHETQLTQNVDHDVSDPQWSHGGQWIVFASDEGLDMQKLHNSDIWIMRQDALQKTQLTTNGSHDDCPCWDRNDRFIYFRSQRGGASNIWRFEPVLPEDVAHATQTRASEQQ